MVVEDELKYAALIKKLNQIQQEMTTINEISNDIYQLANDCVKINNHAIETTTIKELKNKGQSVVKSINSTINLIERRI